MNVICLVVDRLHCGHVGAYGNSWIETPEMDRLASRSIVFDQALIDSPRLELLYRSYWRGWHAMCPHEPPEDRPTLPTMFRDAGIGTALLTDERAVAGRRAAEDFDELIEIDPPEQPQTAGEIDETHLAKCFAQAISWLTSAPRPFLLWCHLAGMGTVWDAPPAFRHAYWDEGEPDPPTSADVPDVMLSEDPDPDEVLGIAQSYAGQVSLLDACLGALLEFLDATPAGKETLLVLTGARGFPLGEHRRVGTCDDALYGELVHVPLVMQFPDGLGAMVRSRALVEPADLWATLWDCCGTGDHVPRSPTAGSLMPIIQGERIALRDRLCIVGQRHERAMRTPAWYLRACGEMELFAKPDDRYEVNNVADRCRDVVECLEDTMARYEQMLRSGDISDLPPLSDVLLNGLE